MFAANLGTEPLGSICLNTINIDVTLNANRGNILTCEYLLIMEFWGLAGFGVNTSKPNERVKNQLNVPAGRIMVALNLETART